MFGVASCLVGIVESYSDDDYQPLTSANGCDLATEHCDVAAPWLATGDCICDSGYFEVDGHCKGTSDYYLSRCFLSISFSNGRMLKWCIFFNIVYICIIWHELLNARGCI